METPLWRKVGLQLRKTAPRQEDLGTTTQWVAFQTTWPSMKNESSRRRVPVRVPEARFQRAEGERVAKKREINRGRRAQNRSGWQCGMILKKVFR